MDALETLVRDSLQERAAEAPSADGLYDAVTARPGRRGGWLAAAAAAVVIALAVSIVLLRDRSATQRAGQATATSPTASPAVSVAPAPAGFTRVGFHGITIAVPDGLPVLTVPCALPASYVLAVDPNVSYDCVAGGVSPEHTGVTVTFATTTFKGRIAGADVRVPGVTGVIAYGAHRPHPGAGGELQLDGSPTILISVTAPTHDLVATILTSVAAGPDPNGCPAALPGTARNTSSNALVPGRPTAAVRCVYANDSQLLASMPLHADRVATLAARINTLPPRAGRGAPSDPPFERDVVLFEYPDRPAQVILVRLAGTTTYSDGVHVGLDRGNQVTDLLRAAGR